jgi:hypothetical protein
VDLFQSIERDRIVRALTKELNMNAIRLIPVLLAIAFAGPVAAQEAEHELGQHPAVIIKQRAEKQGYDYAAQFYPHPAWLYLSAEAPHPMMDHPAVIVAKREAKLRAEQARLEDQARQLAGVQPN